MTTENQQWLPCPRPAVNDTIRWREPIWAAPNKPRGKPDKIGEQMIVARMVTSEEFLELNVISVERISANDAPLKVKAGDIIRRKNSTLALGECQKLNKDVK